MPLKMASLTYLAASNGDFLYKVDKLLHGTEYKSPTSPLTKGVANYVPLVFV